MKPIIDLAPGATANPLTRPIEDALRRNLETSSSKWQTFQTIRATICLVAQDIAESLTLRFDHGRLTLHDGNIGVPTITLCGNFDLFPKLCEPSNFSPWLAKGPIPTIINPSLKTFVPAMFEGQLKIYGLLEHPRLVLRLIRLLST